MRPMGAIVGREVQERRGGGGVLTKMCFEDMFTPVFPLCFVCVLCLVFFLILPLRPKTKTTTTDPSYFLFFFYSPFLSPFLSTLCSFSPLHSHTFPSFPFPLFSFFSSFPSTCLPPPLFFFTPCTPYFSIILSSHPSTFIIKFTSLSLSLLFTFSVAGRLACGPHPSRTTTTSKTGLLPQ